MFDLELEPLVDEAMLKKMKFGGKGFLSLREERKLILRLKPLKTRKCRKVSE